MEDYEKINRLLGEIRTLSSRTSVLDVGTDRERKVIAILTVAVNNLKKVY